MGKETYDNRVRSNTQFGFKPKAIKPSPAIIASEKMNEASVDTNQSNQKWLFITAVAVASISTLYLVYRFCNSQNSAVNQEKESAKKSSVSVREEKTEKKSSDAKLDDKNMVESNDTAKSDIKPINARVENASRYNRNSDENNTWDMVGQSYNVSPNSSSSTFFSDTINSDANHHLTSNSTQSMRHVG